MEAIKVIHTATRGVNPNLAQLSQLAAAAAAAVAAAGAAAPPVTVTVKEKEVVTATPERGRHRVPSRRCRAMEE
jgi:hypothetical protein